MIKKRTYISGWTFDRLNEVIKELKEEYPYLTDKDFKIDSVTDQGDPGFDWVDLCPDSYVYLIYHINQE